MTRRFARTLAGRRLFPVAAAIAPTDRVARTAPSSHATLPGLIDLSTQDLGLAWRQLHRTGPPPGLSRDLMIRALAHQLQERTEDGASPGLRRRLQVLAGEFEKGRASFDPGIMPKTGTMLVRQWRGHTHTVLVREDGFEYEGEHYRSLTVIADRITGAHWSGPRFFGLTKRAGGLVGAEACR